MSFGFYIVKDK